MLRFPHPKDRISVKLWLKRHPPTHWLDRALWRFVQSKQVTLDAIIVRSDDGSPYLLRVYLTQRKHGVDESAERPRRLPAVYLHYFFRGDDDREVHNHPWEHALSWILTNGYLEERLDADDRVIEYTRKPGSINFLTKNTFHRVLLLGTGCWTLFIAGRRVAEPRGRDWGFLDTSTRKFITWGERESERAARRAEAAQ